jgi:hypothetical protein
MALLSAVTKLNAEFVYNLHAGLRVFEYLVCHIIGRKQTAGV